MKTFFASLMFAAVTTTAHAQPASTAALLEALNANAEYQERVAELQPTHVSITRLVPSELSEDRLQACTQNSRSGSVLLVELAADEDVYVAYYGTRELPEDLAFCGSDNL